MLLASEVAAKGGLEVHTIGNRIADRSTLEMGTDRHAWRMAEEIEKRCTDWIGKIAILQGEYEDLMEKLEARPKARDMATAPLMEEIEGLVEKIEREQRERHALIHWAEEHEGVPELLSRGTLHEGTRIHALHDSLELLENERNLLVKECRTADDPTVQIRKFTPK